MTVPAGELLLSTNELVVEVVNCNDLHPDQKAEVDRLWDSQKRKSSSAFDGMILGLLEVDTLSSPPVVKARRLPYREFWAWRNGTILATPPLPLAVSGAVVVPSSDGPLLLWGKRSGEVMEYQGCWELTPAGGLEADYLAPGTVVDYRAQLLKELEEETGLGAKDVAQITTLGLVIDNRHQVVDICCRIDLSLSANEVYELLSPNSEYQAFRLLDLEESRSLSELEALPASRLLVKYLVSL